MEKQAAGEAGAIVAGGLYASQRFVRLDGREQQFARAEFEGCRFEDCDFSYADLSHAFFMECSFVRCRFVVPGLQDSQLRRALFEECSLAGMDFGQCVKVGLGVEFRASRLDNCSFYELKLAKTRFDNCELNGCFFAECDLTNASFDRCRLPQSSFDRCVLEKSDLRTATEFTIDPARNRLRGAKFSRWNLEGLLAASGIEIE